MEYIEHYSVGSNLVFHPEQPKAASHFRILEECAGDVKILAFEDTERVCQYWDNIQPSPFKISHFTLRPC